MPRRLAHSIFALGLALSLVTAAAQSIAIVRVVPFRSFARAYVAAISALAK